MPKDISQMPMSPQMESFFNLVLRTIIEKFHSDNGNFYFYNEYGKLFPFKKENRPHVLTIVEYVIKNKKTFVCTHSNAKEIKKITAILPPSQRKELPCAFLSIPILLPNKIIGAIYLEKKHSSSLYMEKKEFSILESLLTVLASTSSHLSAKLIDNPDFDFSLITFLFLEHIKKEVDLQDIYNRLRVMLEVSNLLVSLGNLDTLKKSIIKSAQQVLKVEHSSLFLLDDLTGNLYFDVLADDEANQLIGLEIPQGKGIVGLCFQKMEAMIVNNAQKDKRIWRNQRGIQSLNTKNLMAAPLMVENKCIGVLEVMNTLDRKQFNQQDLDLFKSFSSYVGWAMHRQQLFEDLRFANINLTKKVNQLQTTYELSNILLEQRNMNIAKAMKEILTWIKARLKIEYIGIWIWDCIDNKLATVIALGTDKLPSDFILSKWLIRMLFADFTTHVFSAIPQQEMNKLEHTKITEKTEAKAIAIPLQLSQDTNRQGLIYTYTSEGFKKGDIDLLQSLFSQCSQAFSRVLLDMKLTEQVTMTQELTIAARMQQDLLSSTNLHASPFVQVASTCVMALNIGGDFYDYYVDKITGKIYFVIADVSGKSVTASLFMSVSISVIRAILRSKYQREEIMSKINDLLYEQSKIAMFVTLFIACYDPKSSTISYSSGGHNRMFLFDRHGKYRVLSAKGHPMGVLPSAKQTYELKTIPVHLGDLLFLYTDGVTEAENAKGNLFGEDRMISHIKKHMPSLPEQLTDSMYQKTLKYASKLGDDFTLLISRFHYQRTPNGTHKFLLANDKSSVPLLRESIEKLCEEKNIESSKIYEIMLATDELLTNIITYSTPKEIAFKNYIRINIKFKKNTKNYILSCNIFNIGKKFIPKVRIDKPNIQDSITGKRVGGFGLYVSQQFTDKIHFGYIFKFNYIKIQKVCPIKIKDMP